MLSINMRVFKTVLLIAFFGASVRCLPVADKPTESKLEPETNSKIESESSKIESEINSKLDDISVIPQETVTTAAPTSAYSETTDYYDQRQNGTDNYRIHIDGFVFVLAPVEALLLSDAASQSKPLSSSIQGVTPTQSVGVPDKPASDLHNKTDLSISKTIHKQPAVRLASFLAPLINSIRHVRGTSVH